MDEYTSMFSLSKQEMESHILGCADGPASFNAEMTELGHSVVSVDPLYQFSSEEISDRIDETYPTIMQQLNSNLDDYLWERISSPENLGQVRLESMNRFLADFPTGKLAERYIHAELPSLPFDEQTFSVALCSHFLFLYSGQLSIEFHRQSIQEMLRVAQEVRIFPLLTLDRQISEHVDKICEHFCHAGHTCNIETVAYEFQRGANQMLKIK